MSVMNYNYALVCASFHSNLVRTVLGKCKASSGAILSMSFKPFMLPYMFASDRLPTVLTHTNGYDPIEHRGAEMRRLNGGEWGVELCTVNELP